MKRSVLQKLKNNTIYLLIRGAFAFGSMLPIWMCRSIGRFLGLLAYYLAGSERRRTIKHLEMALGSEENPRRIARNVFIHLGIAAAETPILKGLLKKGTRYIDFPSRERSILEEALKEGRGAVLATGHLGNWELFAASLGTWYRPFYVIARPSYHQRITDFISRFRLSNGVHEVLRGERELWQKMINVLKEGNMIGILGDVDTKVPGAFVDFFGRKAHTATGTAALALQTGAPLLSVFCIRTKEKRYRLVVKRVEPVRTGDNIADVEGLTAELAQITESHIRRWPEQWIWMHKRWKTRPGEGTGLKH